MNLRHIHAVLIMLSAVLAVVFGVWCLDRYGSGEGTGMLMTAIAAFAASVGLMVYDSWFLRKTRVLR